jgi:hypothetical protein
VHTLGNNGMAAVICKGYATRLAPRQTTPIRRPSHGSALQIQQNAAVARADDEGGRYELFFLSRSWRRFVFFCRGVSVSRRPAYGFSPVRSSTRTGVPVSFSAVRNEFSR